MAVDSSNQVAVLQLSHRTEILLLTSTTSFLLVRETGVAKIMPLLNPTETSSLTWNCFSS